MTSLTQQLMYTYGINRQSENPLHLKIVGLSDQIFNMLQRISGMNHWLCNISKDVLENCFDFKNLKDTEREKFVYLTADASTTLTLLNEDHIYIIGGIVDRNKEKGLTLEKAENLGLSTARLPLNDYCHLLGSKVLTVNQGKNVLHFCIKWNIFSFFSVSIITSLLLYSRLESSHRRKCTSS
jgi:tRNA (guanine9-N1)-methyltransferase